MTGSVSFERWAFGMTGKPQNLTETPHLSQALEQLRLEGAIFFRAEFTENWSFESAPPAAASMLRPGAERLLYFHIVARGECWIALDDGVRYWARRGDVIVLPYGDLHYMGGARPADPVPIMNLIDHPPWETLPVLRHGAGGYQTDVVCGWLHSEDPLFDPRMSALPRAFVVTPEGPAAQWIESSIDYALAASAGVGEVPSTRLPELLVTEILRMHLASAPAADRGWLGALRDPVVAPALAKLHEKPDVRWTVASLAESASVSRSLLDERFRRVLGRSPIRYLTDWRMHLAKGLLSSSDLNVAQVARRVGYESVEAFSRAFKRTHGVPPSASRS
jgi:AraC-like DNA-binding protein